MNLGQALECARGIIAELDAMPGCIPPHRRALWERSKRRVEMAAGELEREELGIAPLIAWPIMAALAAAGVWGVYTVAREAGRTVGSIGEGVRGAIEDSMKIMRTALAVGLPVLLIAWFQKRARKAA